MDASRKRRTSSIKKGGLQCIIVCVNGQGLVSRRLGHAHRDDSCRVLRIPLIKGDANWSIIVSVSSIHRLWFRRWSLGWMEATEVCKDPQSLSPHTLSQRPEHKAAAQQLSRPLKSSQTSRIPRHQPRHRPRHPFTPSLPARSLPASLNTPNNQTIPTTI
ncbi:hypothetical protein BDV96DRAFT_159429 [Lophiotrema nucula]|uniref:Uncharacterized protein n=1 Tax=Lophiotrema nucula TaxID=690887 RepID=A0A6A5Z1S7_9PLEO|nr:hypothetical protein BDV96DRAFT_159429 [Lophiotrema nucula]